MVFGGNAHNDSAVTSGGGGARCYSRSAALYDVRCERWTSVTSHRDAARAAHAAVALPGWRTRAVVVMGG